MTLADLRTRTNVRLAEYAAAQAAVRTEKAALHEAEAHSRALTEALVLAQEVAAAVQEQAHAKIADVVTRSLEAVFNSPYQFKINFEQKRGRTEAALVFERDGLEVDPMTASGGGVIAVAAFALRVSCLMLSQPPLRRVLLLDEPFSHLSEEYQPRVRVLLEMLAKDLEIQFILITHLKEIAAGKVISL